MQRSRTRNHTTHGDVTPWDALFPYEEAIRECVEAPFISNGSFGSLTHHPTDASAALGHSEDFDTLVAEEQRNDLTRVTVSGGAETLEVDLMHEIPRSP